MDERETAMHDRFVELAPWHVNGTLSEADRNWVNAYVRDHPTAAAELEWYRSLQANIRFEAPVVSAEIGLDRLPDIGEFLIHERRRQIELVALVERVEQRALELAPACRRVFLREPPLDGILELGERLDTKRDVVHDRPIRPAG